MWAGHSCLAAAAGRFGVAERFSAANHHRILMNAAMGRNCQKGFRRESSSYRAWLQPGAPVPASRSCEPTWGGPRFSLVGHSKPGFGFGWGCCTSRAAQLPRPVREPLGGARLQPRRKDCDLDPRPAWAPVSSRSVPLLQKRIALALFADCCQWSVAGDNNGLIWQGKHFLVQRADDFIE